VKTYQINIKHKNKATKQQRKI